MDVQKLDETMDVLDYLGRQFFLHFEKFKEAEKDTSNMVLRGACDTHLSEAIRCKMLFEDEIENLKNTKLPMFGSKNLKIQVKNVIEHSLQNKLAMVHALRSVERTFLDTAMSMVVLDYLKENG
jgi:hypothetical protein